jgi:hypothetical protein
MSLSMRIEGEREGALGRGEPSVGSEIVRGVPKGERVSGDG